MAGPACSLFSACLLTLALFPSAIQYFLRKLVESQKNNYQYKEGKLFSSFLWLHHFAAARFYRYQSAVWVDSKRKCLPKVFPHFLFL